ncbi:MAG: HpsJ family protein [Cyanobacteria bacterium P01_F01_bin.42]
MTTVQNDEYAPLDNTHSHGGAGSSVNNNGMKTPSSRENRLEDELAEIIDSPQAMQPSQYTERRDESSVAAPESTGQGAPVSSVPFVNKFLNGQSIVLARKLGYGLLIISLLDFIFILIPPQFLNPVWEYKVISDIVKLAPLPLLALLLIFVGERANRKRFEKLPLKILSWFSLVIAVFFFLLLPLIITDYVRIDRFNNSQISSEINLQKKQLSATQEQVELMDQAQVESLIPTPDDSGTLGRIPGTPEEARDNILDNLERAKVQADERASIARNNVTLNLVKNSIKLFSQSVLIAVLFVMVWISSKWARVSKSRRRRKA